MSRLVADLMFTALVTTAQKRFSAYSESSPANSLVGGCRHEQSHFPSCSLPP
jgi:hypothetical protein